jgi:hypothetical protein
VKVPGGSQFSLLDLRTGSVRHATTIRDSLLWDWSVLPDGGWIWIADGGQTIRMHVGGQLREIPKPDWYEVVLQVSASAGRVAFNGWNSRTADTMRVSELSLADGTVRPWLALFVDDGDLGMLADGSVVFTAFGSADIATLYHSPEPGNVRLIGTIPRPIGEKLSVSDDLRRLEVATRDYFGDVWLSRVRVRR